MEEAPLLVDRPRAGIARLLLNRPERHNALDRSLVDALELAVEAERERVIVLGSTGPGRFCGGADTSLDDAERAEVSDGLYRPLRPHPRAAASGAGGARRAGDRGRPPARDHLRSPGRRARGLAAGARAGPRARGRGVGPADARRAQPRARPVPDRPPDRCAGGAGDRPRGSHRGRPGRGRRRAGGRARGARRGGRRAREGDRRALRRPRGRARRGGGREPRLEGRPAAAG